jgi:flagellar assembly factor FliW
MKLDTRHFGEIDISEEKVINFENGIPGFFDHTQFVFLTDSEADEDGGPFTWMQSVSDKDICFVVIDAATVFPDYDPQVSEDEMEGLGDFAEQGLVIYNIAKIVDDIEQSTVNLKAPIVINRETKKGKQVICSNDEYEIRHKIFNK